MHGALPSLASRIVMAARNHSAAPPPSL